LGLGTGRWGPGKMDDGEARHGGNGEQASQWDGERKRGSRPVRTLTPRQNSGGGSRQQRSSEVVTATAAEVRQRRRRRGLGIVRRGGGGCGCCRTEGAGRRLYWAAEGPRLAGPGRRASRGGARAVAGLGLKSEPGARSGMTPTGGARLAVRERKGRRGVPVGLGRRNWAGWAARGGEKKRPAGLGLAGGKGERGKERGSGPGQNRKRGRKRNTFKYI
jgi:hypothetical protein